MNPMVNSDYLVIKLALAASLTSMILIRLVNQYRKLDAEKGLELAGNLFWTSPNEDHVDVNIN